MTKWTTMKILHININSNKIVLCSVCFSLFIVILLFTHFKENIREEHFVLNPVQSVRYKSVNIRSSFNSSKQRTKTDMCLKIPTRKKYQLKYVGRKTVWYDPCFDRIPQQLQLRNTKFSKLNKKVIWVKRFDDQNLSTGGKIFSELKCPIHQCVITKNYNDKADARLFSQEFIFSDIPYYQKRVKRSADEVWVIRVLESPFASPDYIFVENVFNWTATYRKDSTIVTPYGRWMSSLRKKPKTRKMINYAKGKTKQVAMFLSNCKTSNDRLEYAMTLSQFITVDIYGACGNMTCKKSEYKQCFELLKSKYKFYLSFENANCRDYITEKFFINALQNDVIPVVMGAHPADYKAVAPPRSYIHVEDFSSPKQLAEYLHKIDQNDNLYNTFFTWKNKGAFITPKFWCRLCALLHVPNKPKMTIENLNLWWRPPGICITGNQRWTKYKF